MTTYIELLEKIFRIVEEQQKRLDHLHEMVLDLAKNGAVYKYMLIDIAKKIGLDANTLEKIRRIETDYNTAKSELKKKSSSL